MIFLSKRFCLYLYCTKRECVRAVRHTNSRRVYSCLFNIYIFLIYYLIYPWDFSQEVGCVLLSLHFPTLIDLMLDIVYIVLLFLLYKTLA